MPATILATKLYVPPPRAESVPRPRLTGRMGEGRKLTLVCAPAGFGKTTLLGEWISLRERPVAWLSLDDGDSDPTRFLTYLVAALRTVAADIGEGVLAAIQSPRPPPTEAMMTALLNEIDTIPEDLVLVLDDYHLIDSEAVGGDVAFVVERMPPRMRLVIATREDPSLPLARLRARGELTELRAADLRFTPSEAAAFLNGAMGLDLSGGTSPRWRLAPKVGSPASNSPRSRCGATRTQPPSSSPSPGATVSSSTISSRKSSIASPNVRANSC